MEFQAEPELGYPMMISRSMWESGKMVYGTEKALIGEVMDLLILGSTSMAKGTDRIHGVILMVENM